MRRLIKCLSLLVLTAAIAAASVRSAPPPCEYCLVMEQSPVQSAEIDDILYNPYMGWAPWAELTEYPQPVNLVIVGYTWRELEPVKGDFRFESLEELHNFDYWYGKNARIIFYFNMDYPGETGHIDIPDWLYEEMGGDGTFYETMQNGEKIGGFSPNYKNDILINEHRRCLAEIAKRYDNDPRVYLVCMGSVGHWGEMHTTYIDDSDAAGKAPSAEFTSIYEQAYADLFTNKFVSSRYPRQVALDNGMGLHNNSFGHPRHTYEWFIDWFNSGYTDISTGSVHPAMPDFWKYAPSGGELAEYPGTKWFSDENIDDTINQAKQSHLSWLGPCAMAGQPLDGPLQSNMDRFLKTIGYRFVLRKVVFKELTTPESALEISMEWENEGVAPFYFQWPLEITFDDPSGNTAFKYKSDTDIRKWYPGTKLLLESVPIPPGISNGVYSIFISINDPETGEPGMEFAMEGRRPDGRYLIGTVTILRN